MISHHVCIVQNRKKNLRMCYIQNVSKHNRSTKTIIFRKSKITRFQMDPPSRTHLLNRQSKYLSNRDYLIRLSVFGVIIKAFSTLVLNLVLFITFRFIEENVHHRHVLFMLRSRQFDSISHDSLIIYNYAGGYLLYRNI